MPSHWPPALRPAGLGSPLLRPCSSVRPGAPLCSRVLLG